MKRSYNENRIVEVTKSLGNDFLFTYNIPDTKYNADFFHVPSQTIIEVDGPNHFIKKIENG